MASGKKSVCIINSSLLVPFFLHLLLLLTSTEARHLKQGDSNSRKGTDVLPTTRGTIQDSKLVGKVTTGNVQEALLNGDIKVSGPSPGGEGHSFKNVVQTMGGNKVSGPSRRGEGHKFKTQQLQTIGRIKVSGPSPGEGHNFKNVVQTMGGNKVSGPSPRGGGHHNSVAKIHKSKRD